jgi:hypothetical protein
MEVSIVHIPKGLYITAHATWPRAPWHRASTRLTEFWQERQAHSIANFWCWQRDSLAEWSKALASGASPQGRGFEPHSCHDGLRTAPVQTQMMLMAQERECSAPNY